MRIQGEAEVRELADRLLDEDRMRPIVALTSRPGETEPAIPVQEAAEVLGEDVELVTLMTGSSTFQLAELLGKELGVFGGAARIWWPGLRPDSHPLDHPLIFERHGVYGSQAIQRLADAYSGGGEASGGRSASTAGADLCRDQLARAQQQVAELRETLAGRTRKAESLATALAKEQVRARGLAKDLEVATRVVSPESPEAPEDRFLRLVFDSWIFDTKGADREAFPLQPFVVGERVLETAGRVDVPLERVARICAWIASGRGAAIDGLRVHALRETAGGDDPQRVREADGATAWRAALKVGSPSAPRLHYWRRQDGVLEFASVNLHDDFTIPGWSG